MLGLCCTALINHFFPSILCSPPFSASYSHCSPPCFREIMLSTPTHKSKYGTLLICAWILVFSRSFPVQYFFKNSIILLLWLIFYDVFYHLFLIYSCVDGHMVEFLSWCYGECSNKEEYRCPWHTCFTTSSVWVCYISIE